MGDTAEACCNNLCKWSDAVTRAGRVPLPGSDTEFEADLFATAEVLKVAMLMDRTEVAILAADTLMGAIKANNEHMKQGRFYLRWGGERPECADSEGLGSTISGLIEEEDVFHCVSQDTPGQLYFMLAFPAMVLLELSAASSAERPGEATAYKDCAMKLLDFLKGCNGVFESPMAHKVAVAAAMAGDADMAIKIADYLLTLQQPSGSFQKELDAMDCLDQSAEIAAWLFQVQRSLA